MSNDQMELPGTEIGTNRYAPPNPKILVMRAGEEMHEAFQSMEDLRASDLKPGQYELWRFGGTFTVEEVPARTRTSFQSAITRAPRKPRADKGSKRKAKGGTGNGTSA